MSPDDINWIFVKPKDFRREVLKLPKQIRPKLTALMWQLSLSENPNELGQKKTTRFGVYYYAWLDETYRLSYHAIPSRKEIVIYRVGDHKFVQGKG